MSQSCVAVLGMGYVGSVTAACFAQLGHQVIGVDPDVRKVDSILNGRAPFFEPGLDDLIRTNVSAGRLAVSPTMDSALDQSEIVMICVGTPSKSNGDISLEQLRRVAREITTRIGGRRHRLVICLRSTVFPGTSEALFGEALCACSNLQLVYNPEFLREGAAVRDFMEPCLLVVGGSDSDSVEKVSSLYSPLNIPTSKVSIRTAEMIKYACNAFHALKISFANEVGTLCSRIDIDGEEVMEILCRDHKLNSSAAYLRPAMPFGGSCLPKDLRALTYRASRLDIELPLIRSILPSNEEHLRRAIEAVLSLKSDRMAFYGMTFKENTDDLRESPIIAILEKLIGKGKNIRVFDPHISLADVYGSNRSFLVSALPHIEKLLETDLNRLLKWADYVVLAQRPGPLHAKALEQGGLPICDLSHIAEPAAYSATVLESLPYTA
jgi:GDP-mannose 6-dehydrogenase